MNRQTGARGKRYLVPRPGKGREQTQFMCSLLNCKTVVLLYYLDALYTPPSFITERKKERNHEKEKKKIFLFRLDARLLLLLMMMMTVKGPA